MLADDLKGLSKIWILGDNHVAETFRKNYKKSTAGFFIKDHFKVTPYCSSKYSDKNPNCLSRIVNSFTQALNAKFYLPDFIIVFLDNDLIEYLGYKRFAVACPWIEYLAQFFVESLDIRRKVLPTKAKLKEKTQVYWVEAANHENFDYIDQQVRETYNNCIDATAQLHDSNIR